MAVTRVTYTTREEVKSALDIKLTARNDQIVDTAIEAATETVEGELHRRFYPELATRYFDWPNYQYAYPWRIWLEENELADYQSATVTSGGVLIPASTIFFEPINFGPPFTYIELNRTSSSTFGVSTTPQRDTAITGPFGYWIRTTPAGQLAAAMNDTTTGSCTVSNAAAVGVGDNILVDSERLLVMDRAMVTTGQTQQGSGLTSSPPSAADVALAVTDGTKYYVGEVLQLDSERVLAVDVTGNTVTVKRSWDGTVLATHTSAVIYAPRLLTVQRGALGTTAATHINAAAVNRALYPSLVKDYSRGLALIDVVQKTGAYAASQGTGAAKVNNIGAGIDQLRTSCYTRYGRQARLGAV